MKIGLLLNYSLLGSGSSTYTVGLARALADAGHDVTVISRDRSRLPPSHTARSDQYAGPLLGEHEIKHYSLTYHPYLSIPTHTDIEADGHFADCSDETLHRYLTATIDAVSEISGRERFDVLHVNHEVPLPYVAARLRLRRRLPFVVTLHGSHITYVLDSAPDRYGLYATEGLRAAARLIVTTHAVRRRCQRHVPLDAARFELIPVGVDTRLFKPSTVAGGEADRAAVVFVGKVTPDKGAHLLPLILAVTKLHHPDARMAVVGVGGLSDALDAVTRGGKPIASMLDAASTQLAPVKEYFASPSGREAWEQMGLKALADTRVVGFKPVQRLAEILGEAEACVLPSLTEEALPMTALEAVSSGALPIAEEASGFTELMRAIRARVPAGRTALHHLDASAGGSLVERYGRAVASALASTQNEKRATVAQLRQLALSEFDWTVIAERVVGVYKEAVP